MEIQDIINIIVNNGIGIVCVAYMIHFQETTMKDMTKTLEDISNKLAVIETKVNK